MGRLIDADKMINELGISDRDIYCKCLIEEQPTAFNVEAVVDELEKILDGLSDGGDDWFTAEKINEAIDIVRKGGVK